MSPSDNNKWSEIVQSFTAKTTFHGVRYIAEETRFISRRIAWTVVVIAVIGAFSFAIVNRILHFREYPSNIELEVGYMDKVPFPVVTLCNQNPYRLTALHKYGVYDIITNTYRAQRPQKTEQEADHCDVKYLLNPVVCHIPAKVSYSLTFVEVTVSTCKDLCTHHAYHSCSGFLYEEAAKSCTLTSYTGEDREWYSQEDIEESSAHCQKLRAYFYRRVRCIDEKLIECTFEDGNDLPEGVRTEHCKFDHDNSMSENWVKTKGKDNTYNTDNGHFLQLFETDSRPGNVARIQTDYINTTSKCIMLFGYLAGPSKGQLSIKVITESLEVSTVRALSSKEYAEDEVDEVTDALSVKKGRGVWVTLYATLPQGTHRVVIEGERAALGLGGLAVDDIKIMECTEFYKNCIQSPRGVDYLGNISVSADGSLCEDWEDYYGWDWMYYYWFYNFVEHSLYLPDIPIQSADNFCRSPLTVDNPGGLSCMVSYRYAACDIPRCDCQKTEFRCDDGVCVPWTQTCDRKPNCLDGSDETTVCNHKQTVTCDFEDVYICGYIHVNNEDRLYWEKSYDASVDDLAGNAHSMQLNINYDTVSSGETAIVISPFESFANNTIVTLNLKYLLHPDANGIVIWLLGSSGLSKHPALIHGLSKESRQQYSLPEEEEGYNTKESNAGWLQYDICISGGVGVTQSLIIQAIYDSEDVFAVDSVTNTGIPCTRSEQQQQTRVFGNQSDVACTFDEDICDYSILSDHVFMTWNVVPLLAINDIFQLYESINVQTGCKNCIHHENSDYTWIYVETTGLIESPGYPGYSNYESSAWLIQAPKNNIIVLRFVDFAIESHTTCRYDRLTIKDLAVSRNETILCGKDIPADYYSVGNQVSLNFTSDYSLAYRGFQLTYYITNVDNTSVASVIGLMYKGAYSLHKYTSRLISPGVTFLSEACLTFTFSRRSPFTVTMVSTNRDNVTLFEDSVVSIEEPILVFMAVTIDESYLRNTSTVLVFYGHKSSTGYIHYSVFMKDVQIHNQSCIEYSLTRQKELEGTIPDIIGLCDFDDKHQCGYIDDSSYPIKWVRDKIKDDKGDIKTVMRYGSYSDKYNKVVGRLVSPLLHIESNTCIKVWTAINTDGEKKVKLAIKSLVMDQNTSLITDSHLDGPARKLKESTHKIPSGEYRIILEAIPTESGDFLYLDRVEIQPDCSLYYTTGVTSGQTSDPSTTLKPELVNTDSTPESIVYTNLAQNTTMSENGSLSSTPDTTYILESSTSDIEYLSTEPYNLAFGQGNLTDQQNGISTQSYEAMSLRSSTLVERSKDWDSTLNTTEETQYERSGTNNYSTEELPTRVTGQPQDAVTNTGQSSTESVVTLPNNDSITDVESTSIRSESTTRSSSTLSQQVTDNITVQESTTSTPDVHITDMYLNDIDAEAMLIDSLDFEFTNFSSTVSHQRGDLLLSCLWNGLPCNESFLTDTETDMGTCISFNANDITGDYLKSDKSGPLYGLRMTLNVENYEHVEDISTDAGIKIHFYPPTEVPIMKNMGYAVSPGYHALFSLKYTTDYDIHLYSQTVANITNICSMPDYLICVIPGETTSTGGLCECPDACQQVLYDAQLSSSALSGLALHSLLADKETQVLYGYQEALNLQQRLTKGSLLNFLTQINNMNEESKILSNFLQKTSIYTVIQKGLGNIVSVVEADIDISSVELYSSKNIYSDHLKRERLYALDQFQHLQTLLKDVLYTLAWNYNPCVTWYDQFINPLVLISKLQKLWQANKKLNETLFSYANIYRCSIYSDKCTENLDFSKFFSLFNVGFQWAEEISFPEKAVLGSTDSYYCKQFIGNTWENFTTILSQHIEHYVFSLSNYSNTESCQYLRPNNYVSTSSTNEDFVTDEGSDVSNRSYPEDSTLSTGTASDYSNYPDFEQETSQATPSSSLSDAEDLVFEFIQQILHRPTPSTHIGDDLPGGVFDYWSAVEFLQQLDKDLTDMTSRVTKCFTEYGDFIEHAVQWREDLVLKSTYTVNTQVASVNLLEDIQGWYDVLLKKYALNRLTKHELADKVTDDYEAYSLYSILDIISTLKNRFEQEVVVPMFINIDSMSKDIVHVYDNIIKDTDSFSTYMGEGFKGDYLKTMSIFKKPKQNLQSGLLTYTVSQEQVNGMIGNNVIRYITNTGKGYINDVVTKYFRDLDTKVDDYYVEYVELESNLISSIEQLIDTMEEFKMNTYLDQTFIRENMMQVDVYFGELKYSKTEQKVGYTTGDFFSDLGGYLGLLLGASIVTVCEVLDLIVYNSLRIYLERKQKKVQRTSEASIKEGGQEVDHHDIEFTDELKN